MSPQELQQKVDGAIANYLNENKSYEGTVTFLRIHYDNGGFNYALFIKKSMNEKQQDYNIDLNDVAKLDTLKFLGFKLIFQQTLKSFFEKNQIQKGSINIKNNIGKNQYYLYESKPTEQAGKIEFTDVYKKEVKINEII